MFQRELHPLRVGPHLRAVPAVLDPAQAVRTPDDLEAPVPPVGPVHRDVTTGHVGIQRLVVVPVAVVLVPFPRAADPGLLDHHLVVVQVDLVAHEPFERVDHPPAVADGVVDVLAVRVRRQPELAFAALGILGGAHERGLLPVGAPHVEQEFHLLLVVKAFHHQVAVFPEPSLMRFGQLEHGMLLDIRPEMPLVGGRDGGGPFNGTPAPRCGRGGPFNGTPAPRCGRGGAVRRGARPSGTPGRRPRR